MNAIQTNTSDDQERITMRNYLMIRKAQKHRTFSTIQNKNNSCFVCTEPLKHINAQSLEIMPCCNKVFCSTNCIDRVIHHEKNGNMYCTGCGTFYDS